MLLALSRALAELGAGTPDMWHIANGDPLRFAEAAIGLWIARCGTAVLDKNVSYYMAITHDLGGEAPESAAGPQLFLTVEAGACGYLKIGAVLEALEKEAPELGAAFYHLLLRAAWKWVRTYDHHAAADYVATLREYASQEPPEAMAQYEFPDVDGCVPESIRRRSGSSTAALWRIVTPHARGAHAGWIERLKRLWAMSRMPVKSDPDQVDLGRYDLSPMPSLLVVMHENDAIETCFDEESPGWMEGTAEPALLVAFDPRNSSQVAGALQSLERFLLANRELFLLVSELNDWETKCRERQNRDRRKLQLRAA